MRGRLVLLSIIIGLWIFLFVFQNFMNTFWASVTLAVIMGVYCLYMQAAQSHKARKLRNKIVHDYEGTANSNLSRYSQYFDIQNKFTIK